MKNTHSGKSPTRKPRSKASPCPEAGITALQSAVPAEDGRNHAGGGLFPHTPVTYEDYCAGKLLH